MVQVQVCWYKGQRHKTTTVKHHGSDNQGLFPCLPALQKGSQFEQTPQSLDLLKVPCKKYLTSPMIKKTVQNSFVQSFWHMLNEFTVRLADANSVEEHLYLQSPKHGHQTGDQNPWTKWPGGPSDVMPVTGKARKLKSTIMRTPGYGSKMIHPSGYRMIRIMIYDICLINRS